MTVKTPAPFVWTPDLDALLLAGVRRHLTRQELARLLPWPVSVTVIAARLRTLNQPAYDPRRGGVPPTSTEPPGSRAAQRASYRKPGPPPPPAAPAAPARPPSPQEPALRQCLGVFGYDETPCGRLFPSEHAGLRLCPRCRSRRDRCQPD